MLEFLIDRFDDCVVQEDAACITDLLAKERGRIMDPGYLQREVVGVPRWEWDFESMGEGFMDLVAPFMAHEAGASHIYLQSLREQATVTPELATMVAVLELSHYACLIEDFFDFHEEFSKAEVDQDRERCARITQLKFAGQFLVLYPRHHVIRNSFKTDDATRIRIHSWLKNMYIAWGMSRGAMVRWLASGFRGVTLDHYLQNAINSMVNYFQTPIVMAAIMAGRDQATVDALKEAGSWLALAVKLRVERRALQGDLDVEIGPERRNALAMATWPGVLIIEKGIECGGGNATLADAHADVMGRVRNRATEADLARLQERETQYFADFRSRMEALGCTPGTVQRLVSGLGQGGAC